MSRALGEACWAWASEAWARRRVSREVGEDEMRWIALLSIVADDDVAVVVEMVYLKKVTKLLDLDLKVKKITSPLSSRFSSASSSLLMRPN